jgi:hypothetical protein
MSFTFIDVIYCVLVTNMLRPIMCPTSGLFIREQENDFNEVDSESLHSGKFNIFYAFN